MSLWSWLTGRAPAPPPSTREPELPLVEARVGRAMEIGGRVDSISNAMTALGSGVDKGSAARPDRTRTALTWSELSTLYRFNGYAKRIVDMVPADCTRRGWEIQVDKVALDGMHEEERRLKVVQTLKAAHTWARLYGSALVLMVTRERGGADLSEPLDPTKVVELVHLVVLDRFEFSVVRYDEDIASPNFRKPLLYTVNPVGAGASTYAHVHHTRFLRFDGARLSPSQAWRNGGLGDSILQAIWDQVRDRTTTDQATAVQAQQLSLDVVKVAGLGALNTADGASAFQQRMRLLARGLSSLKMAVLAEGEEFQHIESNLTGVDNLDALTRGSLSAVTGLPETGLFGAAPGGLNTDGQSGLTWWSMVVAAIQDQDYRDPLERLYEVIFSASEGPFGGAAPDGWALTFRPLDQPSSKATADERKVNAEADAIYIREGVLTPEHVAMSRFTEAGYSAEILPVDPDELEAEREARLALERDALLAQAAAGGGDEDTDTDTDTDTDEDDRGDALVPSDPVKAVVWVRVPDFALDRIAAVRARAEYLGIALEAVPDPHVTLLYLGAIERDDAPVVVEATKAAADACPSDREARIADAVVFPPDPAGRYPIVLGLESWHMHHLHEQLLRALAHVLTQRQHADFRAHITLGYATEEPDADAVAQLGEEVRRRSMQGEDGARLPWSALEVVVTEEVDGERRETVVQVQVGIGRRPIGDPPVG